MINPVGERIKFVRQFFGLKQADFSKFANLASSSLSRLESGGFKLSSNKVHLIAQRLSVNPDFLLSGTGPVFSVKKKLVLTKLLPLRFFDVREYQEAIDMLISAEDISEISKYSSNGDGPTLYLFYSGRYSRYLIMLDEFQYLKINYKKLRLPEYSGTFDKSGFSDFQHSFKSILLYLDNEKLFKFMELCRSLIPSLKNHPEGLNSIPSIEKVKECFIRFNNDIRAYKEEDVLPPPAIGNRVIELLQSASKIGISMEEFKVALGLYESN
jgi:transcriptional regulator with XRE-family HTH domain